MTAPTPTVSVSLNADGHGMMQLPDGAYPISAASLSQARDTATDLLTQFAREVGHPVQVYATDPELSLTMTVYPDGRIEQTHPEMPATPPRVADTMPVPVEDPQPENPPLIPQTTTEAPQTTPPPVTPHEDAPTRSFVTETKAVPQEGMQATIYKLTGGAINLGPGGRETYRRSLRDRVSKPIEGTRNVTMMCLKGGISKTSTTVGLGLTFADVRPDSVLAIDANPDAGDLADRLLGHDQVEQVSPRTITDLVGALATRPINDLTELNRFTQTSGRLHFLAGEQDPAVSESLTADEYAQVRATTDKFYPLTLTDCGTGVTHPAMKGILERTQQIVVASGWAVTGAKRAERTLRWLHDAHDGQYRDLARNAVVVLTDTGASSKSVQKDTIIDTLGGLCRAVHTVPFDKAVARGDLIALDDLQQATRQAYLELAATLIDAL